ncbi:Mitochondrial inner membrane protease ATP23 [Fagus crenata]
MKLGLVLKMIIYLFFLGRYYTIATRPHVSGVRGLWDQHQELERKHVNVHEPVPQWWSEDYSLPHRRRPVHNKLDP